MLVYNSIAADLQDAMEHPDVHAMLQIWDSPGGESQGAFEYADRAMALRGKKPFYAIADGMALSAGYLGASAADTMAISTGYAGSIGVVMRHVDMSAALMQEGVRVSHIYAGTKKIDGNSFEPLSAAVRADFQAEIDSLYASFIDTVARARRLDPEAVRATQAATYRGAAAIGIGLVDRLSTADTLISELSAQRVRIYALGPAERLSTADTGATMSQTSTPGGQTPATLQPVAAAAAAPAPAGNAPAQPAALTQSDLNAAMATGATAERKRIESILEHPNASAQAALARQCIATDLCVEQSNAILGAVVTAAAPAAVNPFTAAMAAMGNPKVSGIEAPSGAGTDQLAQAEALAKSVLQSMQACA